GGLTQINAERLRQETGALKKRRCRGSAFHRRAVKPAGKHQPRSAIDGAERPQAFLDLLLISHPNHTRIDASLGLGRNYVRPHTAPDNSSVYSSALDSLCKCFQQDKLFG